MSKIVAGRRARGFYDRFAIPDKPGKHKKAVVRYIELPLKKVECLFLQEKINDVSVWLSPYYKGIASMSLKVFAGTRIFFH